MGIKLTLLLLAVFLLSGCNSESSASSEPRATIELEFTGFGVKSYGSPYATVELRHIKGDPIYNASCDVYALNGSTIIDTGFAYFAGGSTIRAGQNTSKDAIFFDLNSSTEYSVDADCDWLF